MNPLRDYYTDLVDRAVKTAAQSAFLSIGVESAQANAFAVDFALMGGMEGVERHIKPEELDKASEVFLCGTAVEVTPIREIGDRRFKPGEITRTLMGDYDEEVRREVPKTLNAPKAYAA